MGRMFLTVVIACVVAPVVSAQGIKTKPQAGPTRVVVVNIGYVFNNYERAQRFKKDLENTLEPFKKRAKTLNDEIKAAQRKIEDGDFTDVGKRELQAIITKHQRELEEMQMSIKDMLGKKQEDNLIKLWKDVQGAIKTYAERNQIDIVLGYGDPIEKELLDQFPNVNRKMQAMDLGSTVPLFATAAADISAGVADLLNNQLRAKQQTRLMPSAE